jgi:glycosyltransferase involved in cell wall biosynthesis
MNLKVCIISHVYPSPRHGYNPGIERLVEGLAEALIKKGIDVRIITSYALGGQNHEITKEGLQIFRVRSLMEYKYLGIFGLDIMSFFSSSLKNCLNLMRKSDVIQVFSASFLPISPLKSFLPPILSYFPHLDRPNSFIEFLYLPEINHMLRILYKHSDVVIAGIPKDSLELKEFIEYFGVPREKIRFVYEGVDINKFNSSVETSEIKSKFGENIILYVGPLIPRKGITYLVKAMPKISKEVPDANLVLVGGGLKSYVKELSELARKLGVERHIFFEGFVPENILPKYYAAANVFAFPTLKDGYPLACLESMACGTPVVATNLSTISAIVQDTGILVRPKCSDKIADGIIKILQDQVTRRNLSAIAEKRVKENFTWDKIADQYLEIYTEAVKRTAKDRIKINH